MINFILSYIVFGWFHYNGMANSMRPLMYLITEPLLVYTDENRLISIFIFTLFLLNFIDVLHCNVSITTNAVREFGVMISFFIRMGFFIYTIYYGEHNGNARNIMYAIYLLILSHIDWDECHGKKNTSKYYNIVEWTSRIVFLSTYSNIISFNSDIIMIPLSLLISGISNF